MRNYKAPRNLVPQYTHGLPLEECRPTVVTARVIGYAEDKTTCVKLALDGGKDYSSWEKERRLTFWFKHQDKEYTSEESFQCGDVIPEIGQWVRGVVVINQWGSSKFTTTHLLKSASKTKEVTNDK